MSKRKLAIIPFVGKGNKGISQWRLPPAVGLVNNERCITFAAP